MQRRIAEESERLSALLRDNKIGYIEYMAMWEDALIAILVSETCKAAADALVGGENALAEAKRILN